MNNIIFLNIIAIEIALMWFCIIWLEEIIIFVYDVIFNIKVSWLIFITTILWIFHVGSKHYTIIYTKGGEDDKVYVIYFPSLND